MLKIVYLGITSYQLNTFVHYIFHKSLSTLNSQSKTTFVLPYPGFAKAMSFKVAVLLNKEKFDVVQLQNYFKDNWKNITANLEQNAKIVIIGRWGSEDEVEEFIIKMNHQKLVGQELFVSLYVRVT